MSYFPCAEGPWAILTQFNPLACGRSSSISRGTLVETLLSLADAWAWVCFRWFLIFPGGKSIILGIDREWGFPWPWGHPNLKWMMIRGYQGYPYDSGNLQIWECGFFVFGPLSKSTLRCKLHTLSKNCGGNQRQRKLQLIEKYHSPWGAT